MFVYSAKLARIVVSHHLMFIAWTRDVNVLIFLDFSFRYDSVHQKYKRLKRYVAHYEILWHRVMLCNEFSALEYLIQR